MWLCHARRQFDQHWAHVVLLSLSFSPSTYYRYRYGIVALRVIPMFLRHTGHAHVHVVAIVIVLTIYMLKLSSSHCRPTGHAHGDTYGPCTCTCRCQFMFLLRDGVLNLSKFMRIAIVAAALLSGFCIIHIIFHYYRHA